RTLIAVIGRRRTPRPPFRRSLGFHFLALFRARDRWRKDAGIDGRRFGFGRSLRRRAIGGLTTARTTRAARFADERVVRSSYLVSFLALDAWMTFGDLRPLFVSAFASLARAIVAEIG